jgi:predicted acyl esterase
VERAHLTHQPIAPDTIAILTMPNQIKDILSVDETSFPYIFEQNVSVPLSQSGGLIRCNIYRPKSSDVVPVLVTYGPYGKDIYYKEFAALVIG